MKKSQAVEDFNFGKRKWAAPLGMTMILVALAALVTLIIWGVVSITGGANTSGLKQEFEKKLLPVVMYDPAPYEDIANADSSMVLQTVIWAAVLDEKAKDYERNEDGMQLVPAKDVEACAASLYGPDLTLSHGTFMSQGQEIVFDEEKQVYLVPVTEDYERYTPRVTEITKEGDLYYAMVAYVPPTTVVVMDVNGKPVETAPDKYKIYVMEKQQNDYHLKAIRDPDPDEVGSTNGEM